MTVDVGEYKKEISLLSGIPICNEVYTFYYDETGNCRKFSLSEKGYNSTSAIENNFILGGVLHPGKEFHVDFDTLFSKMGYSEEQKELKFKHLYLNSKNYLEFIGSKRATSFLTWLTDSGLYVHYSTLNNLYYSLVDIVDSLYEKFPDIICSPFICNEIKSSLYNFSVRHHEIITQILIKYNYPNIQNCSGFCKKICDCINLYNNSHYDGYDKYLAMLQEMLIIAGKSNRLVFVQDNQPNKLIDEYYLFYLERCELFSNSYHYFDEEYTVQEKLKNVSFIEDGKRFTNFEFINSKENKYIQISDLWCGLLGKLFRFLDDYTIEELIQLKKNLSNQQAENLQRVFSLIERSNDKCKLFLKNSNAISSINSRIEKLKCLIL